MRNLSVMVLTACLASSAARAVDDSEYYTLYAADGGGRSLTRNACTAGSCFASGALGPFKHVCAVLDGKTKVHGNVERRAIYVVDKARPSGTLHLFVYTRTDTFTGSSDDVQVVQSADLDTGVVWQGLGDASCEMAGNDQILFAGLRGGGYAMVDTHTLAVSSSTETMSYVTADHNGYVTLATVDGTFRTYDDNGFLTQSGSEARFTSDTRNAAVLP
jgi:hypothetical protein